MTKQRDDEPPERTDEPAPKNPRPLGLLRGQCIVPDDFDDPLADDLLRAFEGDE